jgi:hypothetical protein
MRWLGAAATALLLLFSAPHAWPAKVKPRTAPDRFATQELVLQWIDGYRLDPEPAHLPEAVRAMARLGLLRDSDASGLYVGFMAGVLGDNQQKAEKLVTGMFPMLPEDQGAIVKAIAYSGLPDWKGLLGKFVERMPARKVLIDRFLTGKEKVLERLPLETGPAPVDTLWGFYFATGSFQPVHRIIAALHWAREKSDVNRLTVGSVAKWTLATNASRDKGLLDMLRLELRQRHPRATLVELKEIVEAAESFETGKIRKDAVAAIEELKRKGPQANPAWTWASVAIAVGCVAASATGVGATVGVPCVLGGALTSAGAKLWGTP